MRRYDIATGILFILSIIEFALAAPKGKRVGNPEFDRLWDSLLDLDEQGRVQLSRPYLESPSVARPPPPPNPASAPLLWPSSMSSNVAQPPLLAPPNPALSTANRVTLLTWPGSLSSSNKVTWLDRVQGGGAGSYKSGDELRATGPPHAVTPTSSGYSSPDDEFAEAHLHPPPKKPNSGSWSSTDSESSEPSTPTPRPASPKEFGQAHADQVGHMDPPSADAPSPAGYDSHPETVAHSPLSGAGSPTEPESGVITTHLPPSPYSGLNSLSADSEPEDLRTDILAAIYAARGRANSMKAKEARQISGIARDVGNAT